MVQRLQDSAKNMSALIDDLLNFARASTAPIKRDQVNLTAIALRIAGDLRSSEPLRSVDFVIADLPSVEADAGLMRIVIDNLLRNAWKYTRIIPRHASSSELSSLTAAWSTLCATMAPASTPATAGEIFLPFHRLHSKSEFPGTGIGLATVQRILAREGGEIWAEGSVEKGATFYFTLPAAN